nr:T9SS type A sorting domain-containing protein [Bacteroidota bacterium]
VITGSLDINLGSTETYNICKFIYDINGNFTKQGGTFGCQVTQPYPNTLQTDSFASLRRIIIGGIDYLNPHSSPISFGNVRLVYTSAAGLIYRTDEGFEHDYYSCIHSIVKGNDTLYGSMPSDGEFVGIQENYLIPINHFFYPNPASQKLKFNLPEEFNMEIYDNSGKKVLCGELKERGEINIADLPEGIYLVRLKNANSSYKEKLIIAR